VKIKHQNTPRDERGLTLREQSFIPASLCEAVGVDKVRLISRAHNVFARNKILVRGYDIYWPDTPADFTRHDLLLQSVLIHELCHVWQYKTGRLTAFRYLINPLNWYYGYAYDTAKKFDDYPIEKQADLLQDWYLMNRGVKPCRYAGDPPTLNEINTVVPFHWGLPSSEVASQLA